MTNPREQRLDGTQGEIPAHPQVVDDLNAFVSIFPSDIQDGLREQVNVGDLLEVVLDLGRRPLARTLDSEVTLTEREISEDDLAFVTHRVGEFGDDNRAGIERTLHRISAIRNRKERAVGLTCRVGRAVFGTIRIIEDLILSGQSVLMLGRPGVGKTTMQRETARVLADAGKRVVIVDTSNEIAGDGDIPHPAIGKARRMQVATPGLQHAVMIEAVENHMPEVIIIDEMGTELEAQAARTIAERGVQLVATAHGNTLENLILNPTLSDLVGGVQTVILGDEEARRRKTQKTVLERKAPPTFPVLVEIQSWDRVAVHSNVAETVDAMLRGTSPSPELRWMDGDGKIHKAQGAPPVPAQQPTGEAMRRRVAAELTSYEEPVDEEVGVQVGAQEVSGPVTRVLPFGVSRDRIHQVTRGGRPAIEVVQDLQEADILLTTKSQYRKKSSVLQNAETTGKPIYVLRKNTIPQIEQFVRSMSPRSAPKGDPIEMALYEAEQAIERVQQGEREVELPPQSAYVRRLQHLLAQRNRLASRSRGREPHRRVTISFG